MRHSSGSSWPLSDGSNGLLQQLWIQGSGAVGLDDLGDDVMMGMEEADSIGEQ